MFDDTYLDGRVLVARHFYGESRANDLFARLRDETAWLRPGYANPAGTTYLPRLTANYGERSYDYSSLRFTPEPWTPLLRELNADAEQTAETSFNALILQLYRDGNDRVNWHSDDSPLVGMNPIIVSMSFGATRRFQLKPKAAGEALTLELGSGDVLVMRGDLQHAYVHRVPKEASATPRINLTFRRIVDEVRDG